MTWILVSILFATTGLLLLPRGYSWVGHTNLVVQFVVTDQNSGEPIPNAKISSKPWREEPTIPAEDPDYFEVTTGPNGTVALLFPGWICWGTSTWFHETFGLRPKEWELIVSAPGYADSEPVITSWLPCWNDQVQLAKALREVEIAITLEPKVSAHLASEPAR